MATVSEQEGQEPPTEPHNLWNGFSITSKGDRPSIGLEQIDRTRFRLTSTIRYNGPTGLQGLTCEASECLRTVDPSTAQSTDLASVPKPFRWWINTYGLHTPAVLIHDRFIGEPEDGDPGRPHGVTEEHIDRYLRFMLAELGVPGVRRWLMWAAVATRTRLNHGSRRRVLMFIWGILALAGTALLVTAVVSGNWKLMTVVVLLPIPASILWGRQLIAGLMIAYVGVPFLGPPTLLAIPFLGLYQAAELIDNQLRLRFGRTKHIDNQNQPDRTEDERNLAAPSR